MVSVDSPPPTPPLKATESFEPTIPLSTLSSHVLRCHPYLSLKCSLPSHTSLSSSLSSPHTPLYIDTHIGKREASPPAANGNKYRPPQADTMQRVGDLGTLIPKSNISLNHVPPLRAQGTPFRREGRKSVKARVGGGLLEQGP